MVMLKGVLDGGRLSAATSYEELRQRKSSSRIDVVDVDVPGDGNPEKKL
jgi:hypothetical protein